jgi:hypothetical protein
VAEKEYIIPYSEDSRKRHYHKTVRGMVLKFVVQLEVKYEGSWREVVRYDCAHGYAHRDSFNCVASIQKRSCILDLKML